MDARRNKPKSALADIVEVVNLYMRKINGLSTIIKKNLRFKYRKIQNHKVVKRKHEKDYSWK